MLLLVEATCEGVPLAVRQIEDTVDVGVRQIVRLRLLADNPGVWMAHCHILPHAHDGMMTVLRIIE
jgi:FtsP/CotA-like multicopper oxidase with cupredoxin domain